uniref:Nefa_Nip30_N domain-containing protein n=1 Tax=Parastrongyloides trichosuri TaxID=131310 RepID=A0A0N4ZF11_PARTI
MSSGFVSAGEVSVGEKKDKEIFDNRPLFERLKEAKNKVRDEQDEANKLANSLCTITDEDNEYYEELDRKVYLNNKQKKADEKDLLNKIKIMEAKSQIESEILTNIEDIDDEDGMPKISKITSTKKKSSSQAKLIENILKRKKIEESPIEFKKIKSKIVEYGSSSEDES